MRNLVIALDFDGTIKLPADYAIPVNKTHMSYGFGKFYDWCIKHRVTLVLWTCRNLSEEKELNYVYDFLSENGLEEIFIPITEQNGTMLCKNLAGKETTIFSTGAKKMVADYYIDDRAVGCPVLPNYTEQIDWSKILEKIKNEW